MTPMSYKLLKGLVIEYQYKTDTDTSNMLRDAATKDLHLVGKVSHEIFNIPQGLPPNVKINLKLRFPPSNFIL